MKEKYYKEDECCRSTTSDDLQIILDKEPDEIHVVVDRDVIIRRFGGPRVAVCLSQHNESATEFLLKQSKYKDQITKYIVNDPKSIHHAKVGYYLGKEQV